MTATPGALDDLAFESSAACYEMIVSFLKGPEAAGLTHEELERHLQTEGRELLRRMHQGHLSLRAEREAKVQRKGFQYPLRGSNGRGRGGPGAAPSGP